MTELRGPDRSPRRLKKSAAFPGRDSSYWNQVALGDTVYMSALFKTDGRFGPVRAPSLVCVLDAVGLVAVPGPAGAAELFPWS